MHVYVLCKFYDMKNLEQKLRIRGAEELIQWMPSSFYSNGVAIYNMKVIVVTHRSYPHNKLRRKENPNLGKQLPIPTHD